MLTPLSLNLLQFHATRQQFSGARDDQRGAAREPDVQLSLLQALARAIDAKDHTTHSHVPRVQTYAVGLARAVNRSDVEVDAIRTASLLHDIGKLAVPEHILSKPGPLTADEFERVRIHPQVGADIVASVPFAYPVAPLILGHHERWDGKGYPQGLKGEAIPIGARILAIADYFDAVTSVRPYHKALTHSSAVNLLRQEAGRALDPTLVTVFIEQLPLLVQESDRVEAHHQTKPAAIEALEHIALAHREIYALYEIARSMGTSLALSDTLGRMTAKLADVVPWDGCALFVHSEDGTMQCRFASGTDVRRIRDGVLDAGQGLEGWVALKRRTLVNADPRATFAALGVSTETSLAGAIVLPLYFGDTFVGCLSLYHHDSQPYTDDHRRFLERVAEQAGPVLHNAILFEKTQEDSLTDPLTSLPNRRAMVMHLSRELARSERLKSEVALMVLDVDDFKGLNDNCGHQVGDNALRQVAATLQDALRPYDLCSRYAGDEFIIVLAECPPELAETKRRELQQRVEDLQIEISPGRTVQLTASAGVAVYPVDGLSYEALLAEADHRMYRDKAARRSHASAFPGGDSEFGSIDMLDPVLDEAVAELSSELY
jgi:diguanylate cyclase (GGDEF)-like protein/putative nucleotidyltransferase with HDIG domain